MMTEVETQLIPIRAVASAVFCPRLFWLEQVANEDEDNQYTLEGKHQHKNVDKPGGELPSPNPEGPPWQSRSLWLSNEELNVTGRLDLVETKKGEVIPVETKRGRSATGATPWPSDEIQITLQALLLQHAGYKCKAGAIWYALERKRVPVILNDLKLQNAKKAISTAQDILRLEKIPPPLVDSPKCRGCSLSSICLPDEIEHLQNQTLESGKKEKIRRVVPPRADRVPLYVIGYAHHIRLNGEQLDIKARTGETRSVGLNTLSQVNLMGSSQLSTQSIQKCLKLEIPVSFFSGGGWLYGITMPAQQSSIHCRIAQFKAYNTQKSLDIAKVLIADKIANSRTLLRRGWSKVRKKRSQITQALDENSDLLSQEVEIDHPLIEMELDDSLIHLTPKAAPSHIESPNDEEVDQKLQQMKKWAQEARKANHLSELLGIEGQAARHYWSLYSPLIAADEPLFSLQGRTRRPPRDRTNAMLSFLYSLLMKDCLFALRTAGLDPHLGVLHSVHHGRPALALDLMEPFRSLIVDSTTLGVVRRREMKPLDFVQTGQAVLMRRGGRRRLIAAYERRMDELIKHPIFGYRISYRQMLGVQARLMSRVFTEEIQEMPSVRTR